jgi:hypothetical protein
MRPTFRKLEVKDIGNLERLVAENIDGVEPGLKIVDSRLLLGQAAIDLVGLDSNSSLVLIALDFNADDGLLLRVMDAYSWCLEYPDTLRRLYPMAQATSRPPRILFIVEKMTDAFLRRVKQLSYLEIDCYEFRNLEVNGASVVYFDLIERIRKSVVEAAAENSAQTSSAPTAAPIVIPSVEPRTELRIDQPSEPRVEARVDSVKPVIEWSPRGESREPVSEPTRVAPPKAVVAEPVRIEPAVPVVSEPAAPMVVAQSAPAEPVPAPVAPPTAPAPVVAEPAIVAEARVAPVIDHQTVNLVTEPVTMSTPPVVEPAPVTVAAASAPVEPTPALALEAIETTSRAHTNGHVVQPEAIVAPVIEAGPRVAPPVDEPVAVAPTAAAPMAPQPAVVNATPVEPAPAAVQAPPVWAKPGSQPNGAKPHFFVQATKSTTPVDAPVPVAATAAPVQSATPPAGSKAGLEVDDRPELESLSFPKDGLSRQWLEFLSQLGATK